MSAESSISLEFVRIKNEYTFSSGGQSMGELELTRDAVAADPDGFPELISALDDILANPGLGEEMHKRLITQGRYLLALSEFEPGTVDGLVYAEAQDAEAQSFSEVRLGVWISKGRYSRWGKSCRGDSELADTALGMALRDPEECVGFANFPAVPVGRLTKVVPIKPWPDQLANSYVYGHRKELEEVRGLNVPEDMRRALVSTAIAYHMADLRGLE